MTFQIRPILIVQAYRTAHNVETAIIYIQDDVFAITLEACGHIILVPLDLSDSDILLHNLDRIGVRDDVHCWLASYLTDRRQCVNTDVRLSCITRLNITLCHGRENNTYFRTT